MAALQRGYCPMENDFLFARPRFKSCVLPIRPSEQLRSNCAPVPAPSEHVQRLALALRAPHRPGYWTFSSTFRTNRLCPWLPLALCLPGQGAISPSAGSPGVLRF